MKSKGREHQIKAAKKSTASAAAGERKFSRGSNDEAKEREGGQGKEKREMAEGGGLALKIWGQICGHILLPWLLNVQQLNLQIGTYLQQIFNFIKNLKAPFASSFTGMLLQSPIDVAKAFCSELELHVQNYTMTAEITDSSNLTEILASAKRAIKIWCQVAANEAELQLIIEHMALFRDEYSQKNVVLAFETL
ncbi:hypothetical protein niasHT_029245 [Heterodera trifolii]|uniref:Uncharacterized protein n=1 Tax=Heterodera trifolii TaxID=157864 RepID=A0ABD2K4Y7_9BILA